MTQDDASTDGGRGVPPAPPTPRSASIARVPPINHPQPLSPRFSENRRAIETLLEHYRDVIEGIPTLDSGSCSGGCKLDPKDRYLCERYGCASDDEGVLALMCEEWNHPAYQQLERLLAVLEPRLRAALRARFERYTEIRVAWCRVCGGYGANQQIGTPHQGQTDAGGKKRWCRVGSVTPDMVAKFVRSRPGEQEFVDRAIDWLTENWLGDVEIPETLIGYRSELQRAA